MYVSFVYVVSIYEEEEKLKLNVAQTELEIVCYLQRSYSI
jgi:hypothetical protein